MDELFRNIFVSLEMFLILEILKIQVPGSKSRAEILHYNVGKKSEKGEME